MLLLCAIDITCIRSRRPSREGERGSHMRRHIAPIACKPWALNGLSERLIVSHYENAYGTAVRSLECDPRRAERPRPRGRAGIPAPGPEAGRARRRGLGGAPRAVLRQLGW